MANGRYVWNGWGRRSSGTLLRDHLLFVTVYSRASIPTIPSVRVSLTAAAMAVLAVANSLSQAAVEALAGLQAEEFTRAIAQHVTDESQKATATHRDGENMRACQGAALQPHPSSKIKESPGGAKSGAAAGHHPKRPARVDGAW